MELEKDLRAITGFDTVTLQPNSGTQVSCSGQMAEKLTVTQQGECMGLQVICKYLHEVKPREMSVCFQSALTAPTPPQQ